MSRVVCGSFDSGEDMLRAAAAARAQGWRVVDAYTPYPLHGMDHALGLPPSRLPWVCFVCGLLGVGLALWFQCWTMGVSWPVNVGGRPLFAVPAYVPVMFEVMVLFGGLSIFLAFLLVCRLFPGKKPTPLLVGASDNRFVLLLQETGSGQDSAALRALLQSCHAVEMEEREEKELHG